jgi:hypothetical protein
MPQYCYSGIRDELHVHKVFVTSMMNRKECVWTSANEMLPLLNKTGLFLRSIITCDESWVRHYDPESKQQSSVWKLKDLSPQKKIQIETSSGKVMVIFFY